MQKDVYFFEPESDDAPKYPFEMLSAISEIAKKAGYRMRCANERSYAFDKTKENIIRNGITYFTNSVPLLEAVLPDDTKRDEFVELIRHMVNKIQVNSELLLIDPYLFPDNADADYIPFLEKIFESAIGAISNLEIVTSPQHNQAAKQSFTAMVARIKPEVQIKIQLTKAFHDRFWIADGVRGIFVGTSLNGIGKRYSLCDYLREQDVNDIYDRFKALSK